MAFPYICTVPNFTGFSSMLEHNKRNLKKIRRKENKKKKLKALLEISNLNDQDRKVIVLHTLSRCM